MPRKIPAKIMKKLYSKNVDAAFLCVLEITADEESPIYLVDNAVDITYKGQLYTATRFTIVLPDDSADATPTSTIVFADMQNQFLDLVRNYDSIAVTLEIVAAEVSGSISLTDDNSSEVYDTVFYSSDGDLFYSANGNDFYTLDGDPVYIYKRESYVTAYETKVGPYNMIMSNASGDASTSTFEISIDDIGQYNFPKGTFNSTDFPALY